MHHHKETDEQKKISHLSDLGFGLYWGVVVFVFFATFFGLIE
jgi:hypothetical protein